MGCWQHWQETFQKILALQALPNVAQHPGSDALTFLSIGATKLGDLWFSFINPEGLK